MKEIFKQVAIKNGVSEEEVVNEIQTAIEYAMNRNNIDGKKRNIGMPFNKNKPTPEEFISFLVSRILSENNLSIDS